MSGNGKDAIDAAIAASEAPQSVTMKQIPVTISSTGRPAALIVPVDASEAELVELAGWLLVQVIPGFRAEREKGKARLLIPTGVRLVPPA